jgi:iron uptake system EfeUOB component EfeO/EfeM
MHHRPRQISGLIGAAMVAVLGLSACGSDSSKASPTSAATETTVAPEDVTVDPAVVTAGLQKLPGTIDSAIAAIGTPDAKAKLDEIEAEWFSFEGTVRETDTALYLDIEDQLTPLQRQIEAGDAATAKATAVTLQGIFDQYLAKYP